MPLGNSMSVGRYLCSELVALRLDSVESIVNLEEIWRDGAVLESDAPVADGSKCEMRCGAAFFAGKIMRVEPHEFGWRVEVEFSPMTPWFPEKFRPKHMLHVSEFG
jgi:hypothetical protein